MIDERLGCRLSRFMLVIDWQGCRVGVDPFFLIILGGSVSQVWLLYSEYGRRTNVMTFLKPN